VLIGRLILGAFIVEERSDLVEQPREQGRTTARDAIEAVARVSPGPAHQRPGVCPRHCLDEHFLGRDVERIFSAETSSVVASCAFIPADAVAVA